MKDLQAAVRLELTKNGITLIEFYRRDDYTAEIVFEADGSYWSMEAKVDDEETDQSNINEKLYHSLMNVQLPAVLKKIEEKKEK